MLQNMILECLLPHRANREGAFEREKREDNALAIPVR
jgi:hypothetical protein